MATGRRSRRPCPSPSASLVVPAAEATADPPRPPHSSRRRAPPRQQGPQFHLVEAPARRRAEASTSSPGAHASASDRSTSPAAWAPPPPPRAPRTLQPLSACESPIVADLREASRWSLVRAERACRLFALLRW